MAPPWLSGVTALVQSLAGALPALILVIFAAQPFYRRSTRTVVECGC